MCKICRALSEKFKAGNSTPSAFPQIRTLCRASHHYTTYGKDKEKESPKVTEMYHFFKECEPHILTKDFISSSQPQIVEFLQHVETVMCHLDHYYDSHVVQKCISRDEYQECCDDLCREYDITRATSLNEDLILYILSILSAYPLDSLFYEKNAKKLEILSQFIRCNSIKNLEALCEKYQDDNDTSLFFFCVHAFVLACETYQTIIINEVATAKLPGDKVKNIPLMDDILILFKTCVIRLLVTQKTFICVYTFDSDTKYPILVFSPLYQVSCRQCGKVANLKRCTKCSHSLYCSTQCQHHHWTYHKTECNLIAEFEEKKNRIPFYQNDSHFLMTMD